MSNIDPRMVKWDDEPAKIDPRMVKWEDAPQEQGVMSQIGDALKWAKKQQSNVIPGAIRGAGSIGSTLMRINDAIPLTPIGMAKQMLSGGVPNLSEAWEKSRAPDHERRQEMDSGLQFLGADPESLGYGAGKIVAEIAGTAGAGGMLSKGVQALSQAPKALQLAKALETGGMVTGANPVGFLPQVANMGTRVLGGAGSGAAMSGLVDPSQTGTGAIVGGALPPAISAVKPVGRLAAEVIGGLGTHTGSRPLIEAAKAGAQGGQVSDDFLRNLRGHADISDVVNQMKGNLSAMNSAKQAEYRQGMAAVSGDKSVLSFSGIDNAVKSAENLARFKGQIKNQRAADAVNQIKQEVEMWKQLDPAEFHTPEGLDALKQKINATLEAIPFEEKTARSAAGSIYNAVKDSIQKQAPTYNKVMRDYQEASATIQELERSLSLGKKASVDTTMRKLQSLMRNNVNTNYGNRLTMAEQAIQQGGNDVMPALAGQALNSWHPRSLGALAATGLTGYGAATLNPAVLPMIAAQSPRLMGEAAYLAGRGAGAGQRVAANPVIRGGLLSTMNQEYK